MKNHQTIAVLGTGIMGFQMARRLCQAGFRVNVWNRNINKAEPLKHEGADLFTDPCQAVADASMVISILADYQAANAVLIDLGVMAALRQGGVIVEMATLTPAQIERLAEAAAKEGKVLIDAPVSGGEEGAKNGTLSIMAGGDSHTIETVKPLLEPLGRLTHVGPTGSGSVAKLCNQIIVGNTVLAVAEALNLAAQLGADPKAVHSALQGGFADSVVLHEHGRRMVEENFTPGGPAKYMQQTLLNIRQIVADKAIPLPLTTTSSNLYDDMINHGNGEKDLSAIISELQSRK